MDSVAKSEDLLLAYDDDFTGLQTHPALTSTGAIGGSTDPDGFYEDFTARLDDFVRAYPRIRHGIRAGTIVDPIAMPRRAPAGDESASARDEPAPATARDEPATVRDKPATVRDKPANCGCNGGTKIPSVMDFVVNTSAPENVIRGELDETAAEGPTYYTFTADVVDDTDDVDDVDDVDNVSVQPEQLSILDYLHIGD
jgi:hypothetical protein